MIGCVRYHCDTYDDYERRASLSFSFYRVFPPRSLSLSFPSSCLPFSSYSRSFPLSISLARPVALEARRGLRHHFPVEIVLPHADAARRLAHTHDGDPPLVVVSRVLPRLALLTSLLFRFVSSPRPLRADDSPCSARDDARKQLTDPLAVSSRTARRRRRRQRRPLDT